MSFKDAVEFVLEEEGGLIYDPKDPGGLTSYGISQRQYPDLDIRNLTRDEAIEIYRRDYWNHLPAVSDSLAFLLLDCAVNIGANKTVKLLQSVLGIKPDGHFGPISRSTLMHRNQLDLMICFQAERARHYALLDDLDDRFARGWMRRTMRNFFAAIMIFNREAK